MVERQAPVIVGRASYRVHPDDVDQFKASQAKMAADGAGQPGCLFFNATQDAGDPATFYLFEGWDGYESVLAFHATDRFKAAVEGALAVRISERFGEVYNVSSVEEMRMPG